MWYNLVNWKVCDGETLHLHHATLLAKPTKHAPRSRFSGRINFWIINKFLLSDCCCCCGNVLRGSALLVLLEFFRLCMRVLFSLGPGPSWVDGDRAERMFEEHAVLTGSGINYFFSPKCFVRMQHGLLVPRACTLLTTSERERERHDLLCCSAYCTEHAIIQFN